MKRIIFAMAALACSAAIHAQEWPDKPVQVVLPMQAGSSGDVLVRVVMQRVSENLKQQAVVMNVAGAAGLIGTERIARSAPDGYTIGAINDGLLTQIPYLYSTVPYDPVASFDPVTLLARVPYVLVVHPSLNVKTVDELVALAKAQPGKIDFASGGNGNPQHLAMELLQRAAGVSFGHIPYKGSAQAMVDVTAGRVPATFTGVANALPHIKEGRLRALAVASEKRSSLLPDVPTMDEAGMKSFRFFSYVALFAPAGTPKAIVSKLNAETNKVLTEPAVRDRLVSIGLEPAGSTPQELQALLDSDRVRMAKMIKEAGIKLEADK